MDFCFLLLILQSQDSSTIGTSADFRHFQMYKGDFFEGLPSSSSGQTTELEAEEARQAEEAKQRFESEMSRSSGKCSCQWEWEWSSSCPLHGSSTMLNALKATPSDVDGRAAITNERNRRKDLARFGVTTNQAMMGSAHNYTDNVVEVQDHAGVGSATSGVRKDKQEQKQGP